MHLTVSLSAKSYGKLTSKVEHFAVTNANNFVLVKFPLNSMNC